MKGILPALLIICLSSLASVFHLGAYGRAGLGVLLLSVIAFGIWDLLHLAVLVCLIALYWIVAPKGLYGLPAVSFLIPFAVSIPLVRLKMSEPLSWFSRGKFDGLTWVFLAFTGVLSTLALIAWAFWTDHIGYAAEMAKGLRGVPLPLLLAVCVPLFGLINAFAEEVVYRGVMQEALSRVLRSPASVIVMQAAAFAAAHYAGGFPNGAVGFLMVLAYGIALGFLRFRTKGILAPYLAHVIADMTIGYFLVFKFLA